MMFRWKKMILFLFAGIAPLITYTAIAYFGIGLIESIITFVALAIFIYFLLEKLVNSPMVEAIEGKSNLVFGISPTGSIIPFVLNPKGNNLMGKIFGKFVKAPMDRSLLTFLEPPRKGTIEIEDKKIKIELSPEQFYNAKFNLNGLGVFLYSLKMNSFITKEFFSDEENKNLARHQIIMLNNNIDNLSNTLTDFARAYVELLRPKDSIFDQAWFRILLIVIVVLVIGWFAYPQIIQFIGGAGETVSGAGGALTAPTAVLK